MMSKFIFFILFLFLLLSVVEGGTQGSSKSEDAGGDKGPEDFNQLPVGVIDGTFCSVSFLETIRKGVAPFKYARGAEKFRFLYDFLDYLIKVGNKNVDKVTKADLSLLPKEAKTFGGISYFHKTGMMLIKKETSKDQPFLMQVFVDDAMGEPDLKTIIQAEQLFYNPIVHDEIHIYGFYFVSAGPKKFLNIVKEIESIVPSGSRLVKHSHPVTEEYEKLFKDGDFEAIFKTAQVQQLGKQMFPTTAAQFSNALNGGELDDDNSAMQASVAKVLITSVSVVAYLFGFYY